MTFHSHIQLIFFDQWLLNESISLDPCIQSSIIDLTYFTTCRMECVRKVAVNPISASDIAIGMYLLRSNFPPSQSQRKRSDYKSGGFPFLSFFLLSLSLCAIPYVDQKSNWRCISRRQGYIQVRKVTATSRENENAHKDIAKSTYASSSTPSSFHLHSFVLQATPPPPRSSFS